MAKKILVYQIWAGAWRSLKEMIKHLDRVAALGADCVWLSGALSSPQFDHGYDVCDYYTIDRRYGNMKSFQMFVDRAHVLGLKVVIDLVLNHTSIFHPWFTEHPGYYCWNYADRPDWKNLFDGGSAWEYDATYDLYYLHLFHKTQADLNWFPSESGELNRSLVYEFRNIVKFWTKEYKVDGFRLDVPQSINKDFDRDTLDFSDLLYRKKAIEVLNAVFPLQESHPLLIAELFDPDFGGITRYYTDNTSIDYAMNMMLKQSKNDGLTVFRKQLQKSVINPKFMVDLESHDSPRCSYKQFGPQWFTHQIFASNAQAICLYQGQELGLGNPTKKQLSDADMLKLDAQTAMQHKSGKSLEELRPISRANARIPLPLDEYKKQEMDSKSFLNLVKLEAKNWHT